MILLIYSLLILFILFPFIDFISRRFLLFMFRFFTYNIDILLCLEFPFHKNTCSKKSFVLLFTATSKGKYLLRMMTCDVRWKKNWNKFLREIRQHHSYSFFHSGRCCEFIQIYSVHFHLVSSFPYTKAGNSLSKFTKGKLHQHLKQD